MHKNNSKTFVYTLLIRRCLAPFCVYCVTVDTLVIVWLNFGVCMYVYEDSNFGNFRLPYVYAYAHIWLKHQACEATITKVAST